MGNIFIAYTAAISDNCNSHYDNHSFSSCVSRVLWSWPYFGEMMDKDIVKQNINDAKSKLAAANTSLDAALAELDKPNGGTIPIPPSDKIIRVKSGEDLQKAVDSAADGYTILVAPGATFAPLRCKPRSGSISIRPDTANLPAQGSRITPDYKGICFNLQSQDENPSLIFDQRASGYSFDCVNVIGNNKQGNQIWLGSDAEVDPNAVPKNIALNHLLCIADPTFGGKRGILMNCGQLLIQDSWIEQFFASGFDSQAICGYNGPGPFTIANTFMNATGENFLTGGSTSRNVGMMPRNLMIYKCDLEKYLGWRNVHDFQVKNNLEIKAGIGITVRGTICKYTWKSAQLGFPLVLTPRNQYNDNPFVQLKDILIENCIFRDAAGFLNLLGTDDTYPSQRTTNIKISNCLVYNIDPATYCDPSNGEWGTGRIAQVMRGPLNLTIDHCTVIGKNINNLLEMDGAKADGFNYTNCILPEGEYGMGAPNLYGNPQGVWSKYTQNSKFEGNAILQGGARDMTYPGTTNKKFPPGTRMVDENFRPLVTTTTTDGKPVGCDIDALLNTTGPVIW